MAKKSRRQRVNLDEERRLDSDDKARSEGVYSAAPVVKEDPNQMPEGIRKRLRRALERGKHLVGQ